MIGKDQPIAAITGTFFSPECSTPVADVLVDGDLKAKGNRGMSSGLPRRRSARWSALAWGGAADGVRIQPQREYVGQRLAIALCACTASVAIKPSKAHHDSAGAATAAACGAAALTMRFALELDGAFSVSPE